MINVKEDYSTSFGITTMKSIDVQKFSGAFHPFLTIDVLNRLGVPKNLITIALSLLEEDMSFEFVSKNRLQIAHFLESKSKAKQTELRHAGTIFISDQLNELELNKLVSFVFRKGNPSLDKQTTFVISVKRLGANLCSNGLRLFINQDKRDGTSYDVEGLSSDWITERQLINKQFTGGITLILIDQFNRYISIPNDAMIEFESF